MAQLDLKQEISILPVTQENLAETWSFCQKFFAGANRYRYQQIQPKELFIHVKSGAAHLYVALVDGNIMGACVVCVEGSLHGEKSLFIPIMGGTDLLTWGRELDSLLVSIAKANGCKTIEYIGRSGFSRLDKSYVEDGRIYIKEV